MRPFLCEETMHLKSGCYYLNPLLLAVPALLSSIPDESPIQVIAWPFVRSIPQQESWYGVHFRIFETSSF